MASGHTETMKTAMTVGILGAGQMGQTLARLFLAAGHDVVLANSRGPASLSALVAELGKGARAGTPAEAVRDGDVVVIATRWEQTAAAVQGLGPFDGKVVIDTTNNRFGPGPKDIVDLGDLTSSEAVAALMPGARVVKAFNHQPIPVLGKLRRPESRYDERQVLFIAGDDAEAKKVVAGLIRDIGGEPMDTGTLRDGGKLQGTGGPLAGYNRLLSVSEASELLRHLGVGAPELGTRG